MLNEKNAQCHLSSERCKLKLQWAIISHLSSVFSNNSLITSICTSVLLCKWFSFGRIFIINSVTVIPWYLLASELLKPCTHHILMKKNVSARDLLHLLELVWVMTSPHKTKCLSLGTCSVLISFSTHHKFRNELMTSTKLPLYFNLE